MHAHGIPLQIKIVQWTGLKWLLLSKCFQFNPRNFLWDFYCFTICSVFTVSPRFCTKW